MSQRSDRQMEFVMKVSKFCNLRCRYCYEYESLANREAMSREQLLRAYQHIRDYVSRRDAEDGLRTEVGFIWHGGEPLLMEPQYYWDTFADQEAVFGPDANVRNTLQTNLTVLDEERIRLLRDGFDTVGVSVDLFGGLRVNVAGRNSQPKVLENMQTLRSLGVPFNTITVLTKANLERLPDIYTFFRRAEIPFRILPLFDGAFDNQHRGYEMSTQDILGAFRSLVDQWMEQDGFLSVYPTLEQVQVVLHHLRGGQSPRYYNKRAWLPVLLVNTNGDCYCYGDPYEAADWCLGNLFTSPLGDILSSPNFDKSALAAERRMAQNCTRCKYFGSCSGYPIAEEHYNCLEKTPDGGRACVVDRGLFEHIEQRIRQQGDFDTSGRFEARLPLERVA